MMYDDTMMDWGDEVEIEADPTTLEVEELFALVGEAFAERVHTGEDVGVTLREWVGVEGMSVPDEWSCDWMWGLDADAWWGEVTYEEHTSTHENWELWSDLDPEDELERHDDDAYYDGIDEEECEAKYIEELDETRWSNPMETTSTREGLLEVLEHLDDWDVHVEVTRDGFMGIDEVVVTSLSGAWDSFEARWTCEEEYLPLC